MTAIETAPLAKLAAQLLARSSSRGDTSGLHGALSWILHVAGDRRIRESLAEDLDVETMTRRKEEADARTVCKVMITFFGKELTREVMQQETTS